MRGVILLLLSLISPVLHAEAVTITAEEWAHPRTAARLIDVPALRELIDTFDRQPDGAIIVRHPTGDEGMLWAEEMRSWLVALGIPSYRVELVTQSELADRIMLEVRGYGNAP